jgi:hypothetical protein
VYADQPAVLVEPLDHVPVDLELAEDYGGKVNPAGAELVERDWLLARASQPLEHSQLLGFTERHLSRLWTLSLPAWFAPCRR